MAHTVNVLLTTFAGLGPSTLVVQEPSTCSIADLTSHLLSRLPQIDDTRLIFTTTSNRQLLSSCQAPISSLLSSSSDDFLPLRLSVPLCGGKGGFGSQLRAAGGRMSSGRKKNQGENNGSNRNLDGRRLRTVTEAKALAEYLALKPEMEKREKEARRKKWEQIVELAERKEEELRTGARGKVDGKWVEDKEEAGERTREAVMAAMKSGDYKDNLAGRPVAVPGAEKSASDGSEGDEAGSSGSSPPTSASPSTSKRSPPAKRFLGFDDDDEFMSDDEEEAEDEEMEDAETEERDIGEGEDVNEESMGKGKGKARA
ncbi:MAG: hypothetical protein M1823_003115 [Watsoniomyces obsoletus]|nr:MAG: hypothetical protein M1823_003115 [Watsoniomyces obsoletus]